MPSLAHAKYPPGLITAAEFARLIGVAKPNVHQAIKEGRIPVYDGAGAPVSPNDRVRKYLKPEEAAVAWRSSPKRLTQPGTQLSSRTELPARRCRAISCGSNLRASGA